MKANPKNMHYYIRKLLFILFLLPCSVLIAQINSVSFSWVADDISSFAVTFRSYYQTADGTIVYFSTDDSSDYSFEWDFGDGTTGSNPIAMHRYQTPGTYDVSLTVISVADPATTYTSGFLPVTVEDSFEVPNVFTPDGDGTNDLFVVRSNGVTPLSITIFDRGGTIVYQHTSPVINWDGRTAGGTRVSPGVYFYVISSEEPMYNKNGFVHIFYSR